MFDGFYIDQMDIRYTDSGDKGTCGKRIAIYSRVNEMNLSICYVNEGISSK